MAARDAEREALANDLHAWLTAGGVIEQLEPGASGSFDFAAFNYGAQVDDDEKLPAIATVDGVEA